MPAEANLAPHDALLVVDVQNDFCPGGALAVDEGDQVVPVINRWIEAATQKGAVVAASRDWHPQGHCSFQEQGGKWPPHCIADSAGARFHPDLALPESAIIITKGQDPDRDQYSAFDDTGLAEKLREKGVKRVWVGGLAQDVCVRATVLDGLKEGFEVHLIQEATRPVDADQGRQAIEEMKAAGASLVGQAGEG